MTLQGETLAWAVYSPVTHLASDVRVTVIFDMHGSVSLPLGRQRLVFLRFLITQVHHKQTSSQQIFFNCARRTLAQVLLCLDRLESRESPLSDVTSDISGERSNTAGGKVVQGHLERITCFPSRQPLACSCAADSGPRPAALVHNPPPLAL